MPQCTITATSHHELELERIRCDIEAEAGCVLRSGNAYTYKHYESKSDIKPSLANFYRFMCFEDDDALQEWSKQVIDGCGKGKKGHAQSLAIDLLIDTIVANEMQALNDMEV